MRSLHLRQVLLRLGVETVGGMQHSSIAQAVQDFQELVRQQEGTELCILCLCFFVFHSDPCPINIRPLIPFQELRSQMPRCILVVFPAQAAHRRSPSTGSIVDQLLQAFAREQTVSEQILHIGPQPLVGWKGLWVIRPLGFGQHGEANA